MTLFLILPVFPESYSTQPARLFDVASATLTRNAKDTIRSLLWSPLLLGSHNRIYKDMSHFENSAYVVSVYILVSSQIILKISSL